jgi:nuclear receptor subfamily 6 group A
MYGLACLQGVNDSVDPNILLYVHMHKENTKTEIVVFYNFDIFYIQNWEELLEARGDLSDKLCQMGDSIVYRLVQWTKRLPFYAELPVEVHTRVLTHKWHELLVLTTSAWHAMHSPPPPPGVTAEEETLENLQVLQRCLQAMMGRSLTLEQLKQVCTCKKNEY